MSYDPTGHPTGTTYPQNEGSYRFAVTNEYAYGLLKRVRRADQGEDGVLLASRAAGREAAAGGLLNEL